MASDAQRKANAKYLASKKTLTIRLDYDEANEISAAAEKAGQSVQAYFLQGNPAGWLKISKVNL